MPQVLDEQDSRREELTDPNSTINHNKTLSDKVTERMPQVLDEQDSRRKEVANN